MSEMRPTQVERIEAARQRAASDPLYALRIFRAIYNRMPEQERRQRRHQGHDGKGFKEEHLHEMCVLYEILERRGFVLFEHEEGLLTREMPQYAAQYVRYQYQVERMLKEEMEATREAMQDHASVEQDHPSDRMNWKHDLNPEEARKARFKEQAAADKAKREAHPFWGAAKRNPAILDNLPD
jgi:hypothetical protein